MKANKIIGLAKRARNSHALKSKVSALKTKPQNKHFSSRPTVSDYTQVLNNLEANAEHMDPQQYLEARAYLAQFSIGLYK